MGSFLRKLRSPWDERKKLITVGLACLALLIVALLLPLAFLTPPDGEPGGGDAYAR